MTTRETLRPISAPASPRFHNAASLDGLLERAGLAGPDRLMARAVAAVLPFRVNDYVVDALIDWDAAPDDPIYRLVFPQPDMLPAEQVAPIAQLLARGAPTREVQAAAAAVRAALNPHPAGQRELNVPELAGTRLDGLQHKYPETVLYFPAHGQTCHAYCTYCFRWAQFVQEPHLRMASRNVDDLVRYVRAHPEVTDVLITGGDPMVMSAEMLARCVLPLLDEPGLGHLQSIRIGTKSLSYWPARFVTDPGADDTLRLFERVVASGRSLALMAHYSHPRELETDLAEHAVRRVLATGAVIRTQGPVIRSVNDDAGAWAAMWQRQVRLGMVPYYMFVERDTGPRGYFEVALLRAYEIFSAAYRSVSGLGRTVRGPVMSATPGKVVVDGVHTVGAEKYIALRFLQCRDPGLVNRPFLARYDPRACWWDDLRPPVGAAPGVPWSSWGVDHGPDIPLAR
ncbi:KamA family radical SAM protein [Frankia sp. R43]|uniref:KamA family radical SAM protein n=1 Tax=Frankia sp. R43 TaxID=269536 RepID=UPI000A79776C|nr:lysine 2,3-aminomutase [Frankia sp. R43]